MVGHDGKVAIKAHPCCFGQGPKAKFVIMGWKNLEQARSGLEKQEIGRGGTMGRHDQGLLRPPDKLLSRGQVFHVGSTHHRLGIEVVKDAFNLIQIAHSTILDAIDQANPKDWWR